MTQASSATCRPSYPNGDESVLSSFSTKSCRRQLLFAQWGDSKSVMLGGWLGSLADALSKIPRPPVHVLIVEGGSILAIFGGLISYVAGDRLVGGGGLLVGIAGVITALTPIIQGWLAGMREERKQKIERHAITNRVHGNQYTIELMKAELTDLRRGTEFKREMIERQQVLIEQLMRKFAVIEAAAGVKGGIDQTTCDLLEQSRTLIDIDRSSNKDSDSSSRLAN